MLMFNFRSNILKAARMFLIFYHSIYMIFPCSFPDTGTSYDILNLADVADVFVANSAPVIHILLVVGA
jgi:hypothetical protein